MMTACSCHESGFTAEAADTSEAKMTILTIMTTSALALMAATHFIALRVERQQQAKPVQVHANRPVITEMDA